jgi:hypothetical protein
MLSNKVSFIIHEYCSDDEIIQELAAQVIVSEISQKSEAVQQLVHTVPVLAESLS